MRISVRPSSRVVTDISSNLRQHIHQKLVRHISMRSLSGADFEHSEAT